MLTVRDRPTLGRPLDALAANYSGRACNPDLVAVQVNMFPAEVEQLTPARTHTGRRAWRGDLANMRLNVTLDEVPVIMERG
jgi:hypothetical protein